MACYSPLTSYYQSSVGLVTSQSLSLLVKVSRIIQYARLNTGQDSGLNPNDNVVWVFVCYFACVVRNQKTSELTRKLPVQPQWLQMRTLEDSNNLQFYSFLAKLHVLLLSCSLLLNYCYLLCYDMLSLIKLSCVFCLFLPVFHSVLHRTSADYVYGVNVVISIKWHV